MIRSIQLLAGWHCPSHSMLALAQQLEQHFNVPVRCLGVQVANDSELELWLNQPLDPSTLLVGWSLGGLLMNQLAYRQPNKVAGLVTSATNVAFVNEVEGMSSGQFESFYQLMDTNPDLGLRRFCALMANNASERALAKDWLVVNPKAHADNLVQLRWLQQKTTVAVSVPWLALLAQQDQLVPAQCQEALEAQGAHSIVVPQAGHLFVQTHARELAQLIRGHFV